MFTELDEPEERRELRRSVAGFLRHRGSDWETVGRDGIAARGRLRAMAGLGWTALLVPEEDGGLGLPHGDVAALHQELARAGAPDPLIAAALVATCVVAKSCERTRQRLLPGLMSGDTVATLCWQGRAGALGAEGVGPRAARRSGGWMVSGAACFVPVASIADGFLVAANAEEGVLVAWVNESTRCRVETATTADESTSETVRFDDVTVADEAVLITADKGAHVLEEALDTARLAACAELLGTMEQAFATTLDYLRQRCQFGRAIGSFQILQHRAVDLYIQIELARSALLRAVASFEGGADARGRAAAVSAAKSRCSEAALLVAKHSVQLHGAIGYTEEYSLSRYIRRTLSLSSYLGNAASHRARYANTIVLGGLR